MPQALYYPSIDISDDAWLKTALLYWDSVRTIVPESFDTPYSTITGRSLQDAGFLIPLRVHSEMDEIEDLADDVLTYLGTTEGAELLLTSSDCWMHDIHVDKLPYEFGELVGIHPSKLPNKIRKILRDLVTPSRRGDDWLRVNEKFARYYMTLLASRLSERIGARLLTSLPAADRLAISARLDAQLSGVITGGMQWNMRHWREYEAFGPRNEIPRKFAPGLLANLAIERIGIAPDTPIDRLIEFRENHIEELAQFQKKVEQLIVCVEDDLTIEALRQNVADIYTGEIAPAIANLKAALQGHRIRFLIDAWQKISFMSVGPSAMLVLSGLNFPTALLAGAGISLIANKIMYNVEKREKLQTNPFTYLYSLERELL